MTLLWSIAAFAAAIYCIARAIVDVRQRKYAWAAFGIVSAAIFLLTPVKDHAVTVTLPVAR